MELDEFDKDNPKEFLKSLKNINKLHAKLGAPLNILLYSKISKKIHKIAKF
jgi:hypothetical protein